MLLRQHLFSGLSFRIKAAGELHLSERIVIYKNNLLLPTATKQFPIKYKTGSTALSELRYCLSDCKNPEKY